MIIPIKLPMVSHPWYYAVDIPTEIEGHLIQSPEPGRRIVISDIVLSIPTDNEYYNPSVAVSLFFSESEIAVNGTNVLTAHVGSSPLVWSPNLPILVGSVNQHLLLTTSGPVAIAIAGHDDANVVY